MSEVNRIGFEGDTLVVVKAGGSERYAAATITKIEFLMELSGVDDPRDAAALVKAVHLFQNQPNPFSPETQIAFDLPKAGPVELVIYSVDGRLVRRLVKERRARPAGTPRAGTAGTTRGRRSAAGSTSTSSPRRASRRVGG